jgi:5-methylcytosine-specific restriction endonuclease McrA
VTLFDSDGSALIRMREPCRHCGCPDGTITTKGGQDSVYCAACHRYARYNATRTETGRETRTVRRSSLAPSKVARVLAAHHHACVSCGARSPDVELHIGHLVPRDAALQLGLPEHLVDHDFNLAPMCPECNLGLGKNPIALGLMYRLLVLHLKTANEL